MDIETIFERKEELERNLLKQVGQIITDFQIDTGIKITSVDFILTTDIKNHGEKDYYSYLGDVQCSISYKGVKIGE